VRVWSRRNFVHRPTLHSLDYHHADDSETQPDLGFEMNTDDEIAELWIAAATGAGVDISRELLEIGSGQQVRAA